MDLTSFRVGVNDSRAEEIYSDNSEVLKVRKYFSTSTSNKENVSKYEAVDDILSFYTELNSLARNDKSNLYRVNNQRKDYPVSLSTIYNQCVNLSQNEAPYKMIVKIANEDMEIVRLLITQHKKVLRHDRQFVPIGRVQQLDNSCIRWLAKQPGYTAEEKAGNKQKLLGIVRYETADTLENRVFKQYLKHCLNECQRYVRRYGIEYKDSDNLKTVKRFLSLVESGLNSLSMNEISNLNGVPMPNYTLQNNKFYRTIWQHYLLLVNHISEIELLWKNRHKVMCELMNLITFSVVDNTLDFRSNISHEMWINSYPEKDGFCTSKFIYLNVDLSGIKSIKVECNNWQLYESVCYNSNIKSSKYSLYFLPDAREVNQLATTRIINKDSFVYSENDAYLTRFTLQSKECILTCSDNTNMVSVLFDKIKKWNERGMNNVQI